MKHIQRRGNFIVRKTALAGVAQWIECWPVNQRVVGLISRRDTCLGCRPGLHLGVCERQPHIDVSPYLSPSLPLTKSNNNLKNKYTGALASVAQWTECQPPNQKVASSIPSQTHAWVVGQVFIQFRVCEEQPRNVSLAHQCFSYSFPLSLKISK